jgi:hypothetical protein
MEYEIDELDSDCWTLLDSDHVHANRAPKWLPGDWDPQTGVLIPEESCSQRLPEPAFAD